MAHQQGCTFKGTNETTSGHTFLYFRYSSSIVEHVFQNRAATSIFDNDSERLATVFNPDWQTYIISI